MNDENVTPMPGQIVGMEVENTMYTPGMVSDLLKRNRDLSATNARLNREAMDFRNKVRSVLTEMVADGTLAKSDANEALEEMGLDRLPTRYTADVTITATVAFESTDDDDEVEGQLNDMQVDLDHYQLTSFDVQSVRVDVDRVDVDEL